MLSLLLFGMAAGGGYLASKATKNAAGNTDAGLGGGFLPWLLKK